MSKNFKSIGKWWNDKNIELMEINGKTYALSGWNGERFTKCWECEGEGNREASKEEYTITPKYKCINEENDEWEIVEYEVE